MNAGKDNTIIVVGGGIGGMACALGLIQAGFDVTLLEQAPEIGEIGAGIQLGPNAFAAMDALGCGPRARARAVYTDDLIMMDAVDETVVGLVPVREDFRKRFNNPYAVIHRADIHLSIYEEVQTKKNVEVHTSTRITDIEVSEKGVRVTDQNGRVFEGAALIGADGVHSVVRKKTIGDGIARVPGHVVYRAVTPRDEFPEDLRWNAATIWVGPRCHLVHYPMRGGEVYNIVVTFHSREKEEWGVREGSRDEVMSYFTHISAKPRQLLDKPTSWKRWTIADRDPVEKWGEGRATLLGDAAHPMLQYMAQGACMALEDAVTLREALKVCDRDIEKAFKLYEKKRVPRTGRVVLSAREMGRIFHADGVERLIRNNWWQGRSPDRYYDAVDWLYGWTVDKCLD
jgi:2-polyprenyl-6-methoxyphenol hydroxylase-like FAD-dependent oxidoreductase